jgi:ATP-dependent Clp protease ATP-binding subunit ClpA
LENLKKLVAQSGIQLQFSDYLLDYLAENGFDPQFGARPLKRLIQKEIVNALSKKILAGAIDKTTRCWWMCLTMWWCSATMWSSRRQHKKSMRF